METLIFAFIAARHLFNPQENVLAEAPQLPPFDLQSLRYVYGATERSNQPASRSERLASRSSPLLIDRLMCQSTNPDSSQNPFFKFGSW